MRKFNVSEVWALARISSRALYTGPRSASEGLLDSTIMSQATWLYSYPYFVYSTCLICVRSHKTSRVLAFNLKSSSLYDISNSGMVSSARSLSQRPPNDPCGRSQVG